MRVFRNFFEETPTPSPLNSNALDHVDIRNMVRCEVEAQLKGNQKPLSSCGPFINKFSTSNPNNIEDMSFEEIRMMYYESNAFIHSAEKLVKAMKDAENRMETLIAMNKDVLEKLTSMYSYTVTTKKLQDPTTGPQPENNTISTEKASHVVQQKPDKDTSTDLDAQNQNAQPTSSAFKPISQDQPKLKLTGLDQLPKQGNKIFGSVRPQEAKEQCLGQQKQPKKHLIAFSAFDHWNTLTYPHFDMSTMGKQNKNGLDTKKPLEQSEPREEPKKQQEYNEELDDLDDKTTPIPNVTLLIIKPKDMQTSEETHNEVKKNIDPADLSVQIDNISNGFEGSIIIKCSNEESAEILEAEVGKKFCSDYYVEVLHHAKDPQILIDGIENQINDVDLVDIIKTQNKLNGKIQLVRSFETKRNAFNHSVAIEVDKNLYKEIMKQKDPGLYIGWNKCFVRDKFNISRCFSCWGFNHTHKSSSCTKSTT